MKKQVKILIVALILVGIKMRETAEILDIPLYELGEPGIPFHVVAIKRGSETIIPRGDDVIKLHDIVYFTTLKGNINKIIDACGKHPVNIRKILIMGGSRIAVRLADMLDDSYDIKIIETDKEKCLKLVNQLPSNCSVVNGDARDLELLKEEGIANYDTFIALTDSSETNILACLTAKESGVPKTIAEVENIQFIAAAENLNIGTVINKKLLASSTIFQILLDFDSSNAKCLALADAEVAELVVKEGSKITKASVKDLKLSQDMTIGGLIRNGKGMLVDGHTQIMPGDHVLVFCLSGAIHKIEKMFN